MRCSDQIYISERRIGQLTLVTIAVVFRLRLFERCSR